MTRGVIVASDNHTGENPNIFPALKYPTPQFPKVRAPGGRFYYDFCGYTLDPIFAPIQFQFDLPGRRAKVSIPGVLETENQPIRNPVTGAPHRIQIVMPEGFEHRSAEVCSARIASTGGIKFEVPQGHGSLATVEQTPEGVAA